jgi:predicted esterase
MRPAIAILLAVLVWQSAGGQEAELLYPRDLVTDFWRATTEAERSAAADELSASAGSPEALYRWFRLGPEYDAEAATGVVIASRSGPTGEDFPYAVLVPDDYDPATAYPVEFMLHGGVGRPQPPEDGVFWRGGYDNLRRDDRLVVVPAAWRDAYWWHENQAENLPAILRRVRRDYHVDDNRVSLTGVSDGGTGAWFFAFKQPGDWASFFSYIGHPGVLRSPESGGGYRLYFENLMSKPIYIVNGENDRLYPAASLGSFVEILEQEGVEHTFRVIAGGGHNTNWLPEERPAIEAFRQQHPRDPFPEQIQWVADRVDSFNQNHWIRIDELAESGRPALLQLDREGNVFSATVRGVREFTLLLNPDEVNFADPLLVSVNGRVVYTGTVRQSMATLLESAQALDREFLYTATLSVEAP